MKAFSISFGVTLSKIWVPRVIERRNNSSLHPGQFVGPLITASLRVVRTYNFPLLISGTTGISGLTTGISGQSIVCIIVLLKPRNF